MTAQILKFIKKNYHIIIFCFAGFSSAGFVLYQDGLWGYLDLSYGIVNLFGNESSFLEIFRSLADHTFFGFDNTQLFSTRFVNIFTEIFIIKIFGNLAQFVYFLLFFVLSFILAKKSLSLIFDERSSHIGALLYTFNPISFYLLNEAGFFFVYFSLPLIIYSFVAYFKKEKISYGHILLFALGISLLTSYARVSFIYFGIILMISAVYYKNILSIFKNQKVKLTILSTITALIFFPIVFSFLYPRISGDNKYFAGIANYSGSFIGLGEALYEKQSEVSFSQGFILTEITTNFSANLQGSDVFIVFSLMYFFGFFIWAIYILINKSITFAHRKIVVIFLIVILLSIFLKMLAYFTTESSFVNISYTYLPFLANTSLWVMFGFVVGYVGLVTFIFSHSQKRYKFFVAAVTFLYICISMSPLVFHSSNVKLSKISRENIPAEYDIFSKGDNYAASVFFPEKNLYFNWAPYPIDISRGRSFKEIFSNNVRLVNKKQAKLFDGVYDLSGNGNLSNLYLFNGEDIFVFKGIKNDDVGFDYYPKKDYVDLSEKYYTKMKKEKGFFIKEENEHFAHFVIKNAAQSNFWIYSPKSLLLVEPNVFFEQDLIDAKRRVMLMDSTAFNRPEQLPSGGFAQDVKVSSKYTVGNTTKYPIKIENWDKQKPFLIQMNQTFGMSWKIKWVDRTYFDKHTCVEDWQQFALSNNATCLSHFGLVSIDDIKLLFAPEVKTEHHFEGNFVGNGWMVDAQDIPAELHDDKELYAVIVYEKQIYFIWILILAGCTVVVLAILAVWTSVKNRFFIHKGKSNE